jgi:hypothetical protein
MLRVLSLVDLLRIQIRIANGGINSRRVWTFVTDCLVALLLAGNWKCHFLQEVSTFHTRDTFRKNTSPQQKCVVYESYVLLPEN